MTTIAVLVIFQPFVDLAEAIIKFFAETIGLSWGLSIVMLTLTVRLFTLPLSLTGIRSMRRMQLVAPELKAVQEKYKDDRERQQREMLALYKEHGVNPLASCFPFLLQIPFFIAVYSLLRGDTFQQDVESSGAAVNFLFVPDILIPPEGAVKWVLIVLFISTTVLTFLYTTATTQTTTGPQKLHLPGAAAAVRAGDRQPAGRPRDLLDHDQPLEPRPAGRRPEDHADADSADSGGGEERRSHHRHRRERRRSGDERRLPTR